MKSAEEKDVLKYMHEAAGLLDIATAIYSHRAGNPDFFGVANLHEYHQLIRLKIKLRELADFLDKRSKGD